MNRCQKNNPFPFVSRLRLTLWILMLVVLLLPAEALSADAEILFRHANNYFDEALKKSGEDKTLLFRKAISLFEKIINEKKIHNGYLYYNIGNCYFEMDDIGRAILNYRRAEKFIPNDPRLKNNIAATILRRQDKIEKSQVESIWRAFFFWHYMMGLKPKVIIFSTAFALTWIFLIIRIFYSTYIMKWLVGLTLLLSVIFATSVVLHYLRDKYDLSGVIIAEETNARKGPGESYEPSFKQPLHAGTEFRMLSIDAGWYQIRLENGDQCWIPKPDAELL